MISILFEISKKKALGLALAAAGLGSAATQIPEASEHWKEARVSGLDTAERFEKKAQLSKESGHDEVAAKQKETAKAMRAQAGEALNKFGKPARKIAASSLAGTAGLIYAARRPKVVAMPNTR